MMTYKNTAPLHPMRPLQSQKPRTAMGTLSAQDLRRIVADMVD